MPRLARSVIFRRMLHLIGRVTHAIFALWLAVVLTQPVPLHACPQGGASHSRQMSAQSVLAESDGTLCLIPNGATERPVSGQNHSQHAPSECHCIGDCCASVAIVVPVRSSYVPVPAHVVLEQPRIDTAEPFFDAPRYLQPPATAPPATMILA